MLISSSLSPQNLLFNTAAASTSTGNLLLFCFLTSSAHKPHTTCKCNSLSPGSPSPKPLSLARSASDSLRHVAHGAPPPGDADRPLLPSASAVASAIRRASNSPVEFAQRVERDQRGGLVLPSPDFQRLCLEQLDLFRRIVHSDALLSVYVRPAGSYVMDRLELRRVTSYPVSEVNASDIVILVGNFNVPTGLRAAEAALSNQQVEDIPECRAVVFPMVKHPFVVGFLVAEFPMAEEHSTLYSPSPEEVYELPPSGLDLKMRDIPSVKDIKLGMCQLSPEQRSIAANISRSIAMAYVMDQKAMLLQQSSWQNNVRMSNLVEQIRGPLSSLRTLTKMLSLHMKRSEIAYDIVEDILVQGDRMRDTLQQLQDAVYLTKANILRYNEETLKKMHNSTYARPDSGRSQLTDNIQCEFSKADRFSQNSALKDLELPMPPLALAPLGQHGIRPCNVSDVLSDLVGAIIPLAREQQRAVELTELSQSLQVAIEEPAFRQALSNLIEGALLRTHVGGKVEIVLTGAPAGGALLVIDDDGPDMHYMTQMHSLTPFGPDLLSKDMVEDNMTWNFVAGLTVAREILESYGCVVRVISPRTPNTAFAAGGTRIELWLPSFASVSHPDTPGGEV
ncbi:chloroplast sensor kinase, chloroplastic [Rhodamnia argentea]|uniref:Chloroplast sensor kinase, chloroplastic n=1 Tax=Rhodamnia argentea TaxID=178133 RepID=A0A8B8QFV7_9MYRT|nr:chloroplast sensor kinase, chloroplastic [Rhodamnia argentea]